MENRYLGAVCETGNGSPIFLVPSAGSTFFSFVTLAKTLEPKRPVYSFDLTELKVTASVHATIGDIADSLLAEIRSVRPSGPYCIGGHCWGGLVALEIAAKLEAADETVSALILLESFVPCACGIRSSRTSGDADQSPEKLEAELNQILEDTLMHARARLSSMPGQYADRLVQLTHDQIKTSSMYQAPTIDAPIFLLRTRTHGDLVFRGWESLTRSTLVEKTIPGDTHSILENPDVEAMSSEIQRVLARLS